MSPTFLVAAHEAPLIDLDGTLFLQLGLFLLLLGFLWVVLYRPYLALIGDRDKAIRGRRLEAEEMEHRARALVREVEARLAAARQQGVEERARVRADAAAREREILEEARARASRALVDARGRLAADIAAARREVLPRVERMAKSAASRVLGRAVS